MFEAHISPEPESHVLGLSIVSISTVFGRINCMTRLVFIKPDVLVVFGYDTEDCVSQTSTMIIWLV